MVYHYTILCAIKYDYFTIMTLMCAYCDYCIVHTGNNRNNRKNYNCFIIVFRSFW